jgi:hypothetical protein
MSLMQSQQGHQRLDVPAIGSPTGGCGHLAGWIIHNQLKFNALNAIPRIPPSNHLTTSSKYGLLWALDMKTAYITLQHEQPKRIGSVWMRVICRGGVVGLNV